MTASAASVPAKFSRLVQILTALVVTIAAANLVGWWLHLAFLIGFFPEAATMKPNTALCLLALSGAVLTRSIRRNAPAKWLSAFAMVVAGLTLCEYIVGRGFGIDQLLARAPLEMAGDPLGRMSRGTAVDCLLSGGAILVLDSLPVVAAALCGSGMMLSLSALVGYFFNAGPVIGLPLLRSMSVRTAFCFYLLQTVTFLLRPAREPLRSFLRGAAHHRTASGILIGTCSLPLLIGIPVAVLYRHGAYDAGFGFALLVVLLMGSQAVMVAQSSRSVGKEEDRRQAAEFVQTSLRKENARQDALARESERKAGEIDAQYRLITDALPALVSYIDPELHYVRANRTYETWFGLKSSEIEGRTIGQVLGEATDTVESHLVLALNNEPQHFETELNTLQGKRIVSISHIPDRDSSGHVRGVIIQAFDVTARRREEELLRRTEKLAAVGKLASSIAHEINNPLEAVTNLLFLAKSVENPQETQDYLLTAESELARVSAIASQTLRFHKQATNPARCDAINLLNSTLAIYRPRLTGRIGFEPRFRATETLLCFEGEIRQVLNNFVGNALDAMPDGGLLKVRMQGTRSLTSGAEGLVFTISDTGTGMSQATAESIFEAFFTTKGINGTG